VKAIEDIGSRTASVYPSWSCRCLTVAVRRRRALEVLALVAKIMPFDLVIDERRPITTKHASPQLGPPRWGA